MSRQDSINMMNNLVIDEEKRLNGNSLVFMERHFETMDEANRQLYNDLMMEQRETM